ncbi:MAG TPA: hypothetical protein VKV80_10475 [Streptosporangiaceae bacterium]|nr:hypothetical protein [Streptosporangiaceae bacterium]
MPGSHNAHRQKFQERLGRFRSANPGWDLRKAGPKQIGWVAERDGEYLHATTLTELEAILASRREAEEG